jgi:hypothetical protein
MFSITRLNNKRKRQYGILVKRTIINTTKLRQQDYKRYATNMVERKNKISTTMTSTFGSKSKTTSNHTTTGKYTNMTGCLSRCVGDI